MQGVEPPDLLASIVINAGLQKVWRQPEHAQSEEVAHVEDLYSGPSIRDICISPIGDYSYCQIRRRIAAYRPGISGIGSLFLR